MGTLVTTVGRCWANAAGSAGSGAASGGALAMYEIGFAAFDFRRSVLDLHLPALQRGVLAVAVVFPVQCRLVVTQRRVIMRLGCFQVPLGHARRAYSAAQARPNRSLGEPSPLACHGSAHTSHALDIRPRLAASNGLATAVAA